MDNKDIIKSFLVRLGVDIQASEIAKWDSALSKIDKSFSGTLKKLTTGFGKAIGIYSTLTIGIGKFASSIANSDLEMQKFARRMYMSNDSAKVLQNTLDSMGLDFGDLQDVALNPELLSQYRELTSLAKSITTPSEVKESLKDIRIIFREFDKFSLIFKYFTERVAHFIYQVVGKPAANFRKFLQDFNTKFASNISDWAERVAKILGTIVRLGLRIGEIGSSLVGKIKSIWDSLSGATKGIISGILIINRLVKMSPLWRLVTALTFVTALFDDYKTYREGGVSTETFKPLWDFMSNQVDNPDSALNSTLEALRVILQSIDNTISSIWSWIKGKFGIEDSSDSTLDNIQESKSESTQSYLGGLIKVVRDEEGNKVLSWGWDKQLNRINKEALDAQSYLPIEELGQSRLDNLSYMTPINQTPINLGEYTPTPVSQTPINQTPISQTIIFNVDAKGKDGPQFVNEIGAILRSNKSRLVGG